MNRSTSRSGIAAVAAIAALLVIAVLAAGVFGRTAQPGPSDPPASEAPSPVVTPAPSEAPSDAPSEAPSEAPDGFSFDLDIVTPHDVSVIVDDQTGRVRDASSGSAGDGMSVRWFDSIVENIDDDTVRVTWVGLPQDELVSVTVSPDGDEIVVVIDQGAPPANADAMGHDRVIELSFDGPVAAEDVDVDVAN
jgi:hypothetical protein